MGKLNDRQELFCLEYIKDGNATQAAIRAGYSAKTAYSIGQRLLKKVEIQKRIAELMEETKQESIADAEEVMRYLSDVMRGKATEEVILSANGDAIKVEKHVGVRERVRAAELLAKRYGLLTDNVKLSGGVPVQIIDDMDGDGDG